MEDYDIDEIELEKNIKRNENFFEIRSLININEYEGEEWERFI